MKLTIYYTINKEDIEPYLEHCNLVALYPENDKHPIHQKEWFDNMIETVSEDIQIHTMSDYIILSARLAVKEKRLHHEDVFIYFTQKQECSRIYLNKQGDEYMRENTRIYLTDRGKIHTKDETGKILPYCPRGFCDEWHYFMVKLF